MHPDAAAAHATEVFVRPPLRSEYAEWETLWAGYNAFYERSGPTAVPASITRMTWDRFFDANEPVHALVAHDGANLVGLVHYIYHRNTAMEGHICYLQDLFTTAASRGRGVGRLLIEGVYGAAAEHGASRVYWHTHETNATAMALYDKLANHSGFVVYRHDP